MILSLVVSKGCDNFFSCVKANKDNLLLHALKSGCLKRMRFGLRSGILVLIRLLYCSFHNKKVS